MKIVIDTREQVRIEFKNEVIIEKMDEGDYGCIFNDGTKSKTIFEKKNIPDLFSTLSKNYERFKREIERAKEKEITLIIIVVASLRRVLQGCSHSQRTPISIVRQLFTIRIRYGIECVFCTDREEVSNYITHYFLAEEREYDDTKKRELSC